MSKLFPEPNQPLGLGMSALISVTSSVPKLANSQTGRLHGGKSSNKAEVVVISVNIGTNGQRRSRHLDKEGFQLASSL